MGRVGTNKDTLLVRCHNPAEMGQAQRLAEIGAILAAGYVRFLEKALAASREPEAPCDDAVNSREKGVA